MGASAEPVRPSRRPTGMRRVALAVLLVAAGVLAGCSSGGESGAASCAAVLRYDGHRYLGYGTIKRDPAVTGRTLAAVHPGGCDDTGDQREDPDEAIAVEELRDLPAETAVLWNGSVYLRDGHDVPAVARRWFRAPRCATAGRFELTADWLAVQSPREVRFDGDLRPPYRIEVHVVAGPPRYVGTRIWLHADARTAPTLQERDVTATLWTGGRVIGVASCDGRRFRARSLLSADQLWADQLWADQLWADQRHADLHGEG